MTGGIGRVTSVLTEYFRKHFGWKVFSIYAFKANKECKRTDNDGAIQLRLHDRLGIRSLAKNYNQAATYIIKNNIQIVIIQTSMDVVARLRKELDKCGAENVKVISVLHYTPGTDEFPISPSQLFSNFKQGKGSIKDLSKACIAPFYNWWEHKATVNAYRNAYKHGEQVVLLSKSYISKYQTFAGLCETSKLIAIPNCVPFEYRMSEEEILQKSKTVLMVGRMADYPKRVSTILQIWSQIEKNERGSDWSLSIVGDGPDLSVFKQLAIDLKLQRCKFFGRQNPQQFYKEASIFMMTSDFEGFPMTLVEAQQMGCIPVAYESFDSLREVISDKSNGYIVPNGDMTVFVQTLLDIMQDQALRIQLSRKAINDCKSYSQEEICRQWKVNLESLIS